AAGRAAALLRSLAAVPGPAHA
ncbi:MAG: hypothetical protein JWR63_944, partial [Conexibacter sp.]|nr:hypothetical protein [Conexibacter sp.]